MGTLLMGITTQITDNSKYGVVVIACMFVLVALFSSLNAIIKQTKVCFLLSYKSLKQNNDKIKKRGNY